MSRTNIRGELSRICGWERWARTECNETSLFGGRGSRADGSGGASQASCVGGEGKAVGRTSQVIGFCSYGELSPYAVGRYGVHDQAMALITLGES